MESDRGRAGSRRSVPGVPGVLRRLRRVAGGRWSARGRARHRLEWLNEAGNRIGATLDLRATAQEYADYAVPGLSDLAAVDLLESVLRGEEGERRSGGELPELRAMAAAGSARHPMVQPTPAGRLSHVPTMAMRCLREREPIVVRRIRPGQFREIAPTPEAAEKLRRAGAHSYLVVPLVARGVLLGVSDFMRVGSSPAFTRTDLALAVELATKAAISIDNARLYGRERDRVVSLQRSLLPRGMPPTPGLETTTCYVAAYEAAGVGGDWFDVIPLPGGRTAVLVGDVMAHGLSAAAATGRLRAVARSLLALDIAPERVLARLDLAARDLEEDQVASCVCAVHDPAEHSWTLSRAGLPAPLMLHGDGTAAYLDVPAGAPLGSGVLPYDAVRVAAEPESRLILFTDGLVKTRSDSWDAQLERLREAVARLAPEGPDADAVNEVSPAPVPRLDETALLVSAAAPAGEGPDVQVWSLPADGTAPGIARRLVREQLEAWELPDLADATELVTSELVGNALRHGGGPGQLRLLRHDRLVTEVTDSGPDLPQVQRTSDEDEGGRGLQVVNMLCRSWGSCKTPDGKLVWAEQDLPGVHAGSSPATEWSAPPD